MALTINSEPDIFDNHAKHNVTTSLTEGSSYQNLRIRADLYYKGDILATIDQPKGLDDWDFGRILRGLCSPYRPPLNSLVGALPKVNSYTNKITSWTNDGVSPFTTHITSDAHFVELTKTPAGYAKTVSNNISMVKGRYYAFIISQTVSISGTYPTVTLDDGGSDGWQENIVAMNAEYGIYIFMCRNTTATGKIILENLAGNTVAIYVLDTFCHEIDPESDIYFGFSAPYAIRFTEIYEDVSNVTTAGGTSDTVVKSFFLVRGNFNDYVLTGDTSKWLLEAPQDTWLYSAAQNMDIDAESHFLVITKKFKVEGAYQHSSGYPTWSYGMITLFASMGYGAIIFSRHTLPFSDSPAIKWANFRLYDKDGYPGGVKVSRIYRINTVEGRCINTDLHLHLDWNNYLGGIQQLTFAGGFDEGKFGVRDVYTDEEGRRKIFSSVRGTRQTLISHPMRDDIVKAVAECVASEKAYIMDNESATREEVYIVPDSLLAVRTGKLSILSIEIEKIHPVDWEA